MNKIISKIFKENGYSTKEAFQDISEQGFIGSCITGKNDYYFVIEVESNDLINNRVEGIIEKIIDKYWNYNILKEYEVNIDYKKNTSLIILLELNDKKDELKLSNNIYDIEESPFYFKRYVLTYTNEEKEILNKAQVSDYKKIISDGKIFKKYKKESGYEDGMEYVCETNSSETLLYGIVAKCYIKIPFMEYKYENEKEIPLLEDLIENKFNENEKKIISDIVNGLSCEDVKYDKLVEYIDDPSESELDEIYKSIMKELNDE
ncbi:MAG: ABC-three component system middle component 1 [Clostridium botulinum]|nr:ABC-three component system middle component 1 [Clostridium botulinum]